MVKGPSPALAGRVPECRLPLDEAVARARRISLVLTDCDGVLTDAGVYVSERGEELKRFSFRDGMGVERLRNAGIETGIVTRERSPIVAKRAEKLRIRVFDGIKDKRDALPDILAAMGRPVAAVAYIGDDVNDVGILEAVGEKGLTGAPVDAEPEVLDFVHVPGTRPGGYGAFREFADLILRLRTV